MYGFVDTIAGGGAPYAPMSIQSIFNGVNLDEELSDEQGSFITLTVSGRSATKQNIQIIDALGMNGVIEQNHATLEPKEITVKYKIKDVTNEGLRTRFNRLNSVLEGSKKVLEFTDEDAIFYATTQTNDVPEEDSNDLIGTITFFCSDPYKYGPETTTEFTSDTAIIRNSGTAQADPIIELEVEQPVTFAMVQNQNEEYMMVGEPTDVDIEVINTKTLLLEERGQTLDTWSDTPTEIDGGTVAGYLGTDNAGITVPSYGADTARWHGPALIKEVTPTQDFEVEMMLEGEATGDQTFRIEFYLYDEGMNQIGKMALLDKTLNVNKKFAEGRVGGFVGAHNNYLISSRNYNHGWAFFFGMLRMRRIGNKFEFYVTRIANNTKHVYSLKETYVDNNNEFAGKLKYVQIHIGKYSDTARANGPKIHYIKAFELAETTNDQTPYIAYPGDIITFDHANEEILINGEDRKDLKDFGGSFFDLHKGENQLIMHPENSFFGNVKYRPRYR